MCRIVNSVSDCPLWPHHTGGMCRPLWILSSRIRDICRNGGSGTIVIPTTLKNCIAIPQSATYELQDRIFVYKVVDGKASATEILVTPQNNGKEYIVTSGLEVGDIIVAEGAGLIKEGTPIRSRSEVESKTEEDAE